MTTDTPRICGTGRNCENTCPVMLIGRICPPLPDFLDELEQIFTAETVPQRAS